MLTNKEVQYLSCDQYTSVVELNNATSFTMNDDFICRLENFITNILDPEDESQEKINNFFMILCESRLLEQIEIQSNYTIDNYEDNSEDGSFTFLDAFNPDSRLCQLLNNFLNVSSTKIKILHIDLYDFDLCRLTNCITALTDHVRNCDSLNAFRFKINDADNDCIELTGDYLNDFEAAENLENAITTLLYSVPKANLQCLEIDLNSLNISDLDTEVDPLQLVDVISQCDTLNSLTFIGQYAHPNFFVDLITWVVEKSELSSLCLSGKTALSTDAMSECILLSTTLTDINFAATELIPGKFNEEQILQLANQLMHAIIHNQMITTLTIPSEYNIESKEIERVLTRNRLYHKQLQQQFPDNSDHAIKCNVPRSLNLCHLSLDDGMKINILFLRHIYFSAKQYKNLPQALCHDYLSNIVLPFFHVMATNCSTPTKNIPEIPGVTKNIAKFLSYSDFQSIQCTTGGLFFKCAKNNNHNPDKTPLLVSSLSK